MSYRSTPLALALVALVAGCTESSSLPDVAVEDASADANEPVLDGGGGVPDAPNGPALCPSGACNYQTNAGCGAGQSCVPLPNAAATATEPSCLDVAPIDAGACARWSDCPSGTVCLADGSCRKLCCGGDWTGCPAGQHCLEKLLVSDGDGGALATGVATCAPVGGCDPLVPTSCSTPGTTCQIVDVTGAVACFPEGTGGLGGACPCKGGFTCTGEICRRLCRAVAGGGEPSCPPAEGRCVHYDRDPDGVGECVGY